MHSLLNPQRPPVFCPGCSHDVIVKALDRALTGLKLPAEDIVIVSVAPAFSIRFSTPTPFTACTDAH